MERNEIEAALRGIYERRAANDGAGTAGYFAPEATYRVAGHTGSNDYVETYRGKAVLTALVELCEKFPATEFSMISAIIDGQSAATMVRATVVFAPTKERITTELAHFWTFQDGKAINLVEFLDTARLVNLVTTTAK